MKDRGVDGGKRRAEARGVAIAWSAAGRCLARRHPKDQPVELGRAPGSRYGPRCRHLETQRIEEVIGVALPAHFPHCGGVEDTGVAKRYRNEIPHPHKGYIESWIHMDHCRACGVLVAGRHPRQTSDAVGGAASQLGLRELGLAAVLNKQLSLPYGKTAVVLEPGWGLKARRRGLCQALARRGRGTEPTVAPSFTPIESGWKACGRVWWM